MQRKCSMKEVLLLSNKHTLQKLVWCFPWIQKSFFNFSTWQCKWNKLHIIPCFFCHFSNFSKSISITKGLPGVAGKYFKRVFLRETATHSFTVRYKPRFPALPRCRGILETFYNTSFSEGNYVEQIPQNSCQQIQNSGCQSLRIEFSNTFLSLKLAQKVVSKSTPK